MPGTIRYSSTRGGCLIFGVSPLAGRWIWFLLATREGEKMGKELAIQGEPSLFLVLRRSAIPISGNRNTSSRWSEGS